MENIDNPASACSSNSFLSIPQMVQQINEILIYINKDKPFQLDKNYIGKIIGLYDNNISEEYLRIIVYSRKHYTFDRNSFHKEKFLQILLFIIGRKYILKGKAICDREIKKKEGFQLFNIYSRLIRKLYYEQYFNIDDIELFLHFYITLSLIVPSLKAIVKIKSPVIKIDCFIEFAFELLYYCFADTSREILNSNEVTFLIKFIKFFKSEYISEDNIYMFHLYESSFDYFKLVSLLKLTESEELKESIITLLSSIGAFRFNQKKTFSPLLMQMQNCLVNFDQKLFKEIKTDFKLLNCSIQFLQNTFGIKNQYLPEKAFYFNSKRSGIYIDSLLLEKVSRTYVFSFFLIPRQKDTEYIILNIINSDKNLSSLVKFSLEKNNPNLNVINRDYEIDPRYVNDKERERCNPSLYKLFLTIQDDKKDLDIYIIPNQSYLFVVDFIQEQFIRVTYTHHLENNTVRNDMEVIPLYNKPISNTSPVFCLIGSRLLNTRMVSNKSEEREFISAFRGYIGSVVIMNTKEDKEEDDSKTFAKQILNLKGKYEQFLYFKKYDLTYLERLIFDDYNIEYFTARDYFKNFPLPKIIMYVCPNNFQQIKNENKYCKKYKERTTHKKYKYVLEDFLKYEPSRLNTKCKINRMFNQKFHIVTNESSLMLFLKYDGLTYITLVFEYFYQMLMSFKDEANQKDFLNLIITNFNVLCQLIVILFGECKLSTFETDIKKMFYLLSVVVLKISEYANAIDSILPSIKSIVIWIKAQIFSSNTKSDNELDSLQEIRNCFCELLLNKKVYLNTSNNLEILEDMFLFVRDVIGIKPNEMIGTFEMLKRMLSFMNDIEKNGSDNIILAYTDLLNEYMKIVKSAYISTEAEKQIIEIVNHFFLEAIEYIFDLRILYHLLMILYYNNLVIFLTEDNQKKIISNFYSYYQGNQITKDYEGKENDKKILHLSILCMIDIYSIKPFLFESKNDWINLLPSHPYLIEILISSIIPVEQRENLFQWDFIKEETKINEDEGILQNLYIFDYIKYHFIQLISMNQPDKIEKSYKMINCVLTNIVNLKSKPVYFDTLFDQNSDICNEIYKEMLLFNQSVGKEVTKMGEIVNRISLASEKQLSFLADLIAISQLLVLHHKNFFIYKFLNEIIDLNAQSMSELILRLILSIMNSLSLISDKYNEIYINNVCQMIIVLYNCAFTETTKQFYFDSQFKDSFFALCEGIRDVHLLYTRVRLTEKKKTICEFLFEIIIEILDSSNEQNYIILFGFIFLVNKSNDLKGNFGKYYNEYVRSKKIPSKTNTLFYFLDCQNLKNHPNFPDRPTIEKVEKIMNDQFEKKQQNYKINYTVFFYIKIMYYLVFKKEKANAKNLLSLIQRILYDDIKLLKKEHSPTRSLYYTNSTKNSMFDNMRKCIDDNIKNKKDCDAIRECFIKATDGIKGTESLTDYKKFTYFSLYNTGKFLTDNSGENNSLINSKKNTSTTSLENYLKERTLSSPNGLQRSNTASNVSELNLVIEENKLFNTEPKETSKKKKGIFGFFSFSGKKGTSKKEDQPVNIITNSDNKEIIPKIRVIDWKSTLKSFDEIHLENLVLCPKKQILLKRFSIYFKNIYFNCPMFQRIKERFIIDYVPYLPNSKTKIFNYPTKLRNFCNSEEPPLFYKLDQNFYTSDFFRVSHKYALSIVDKNAIQRIPFYQRSLKVKENIKQFDCEVINVENALYGGVKITKDFILFEDNKDDPRKSTDIDQKIKYIFSSISMDTAYKKKQFIIFYKEINEIVVRRFLFLWQAVEIFLKDGKSYFLNFFYKSKCDEFLDLISSFLEDSSIIITQEKAYDLIKQYQDQWVKSLISTYNYLLKINKYGTRSYKDTNQYPLFPWVILKQSDIFDDNVLFTEQELEEYNEKRREEKRKNKKALEKKEKIPNDGKKVVHLTLMPKKALANYRDFNYPIAFQSDEKKEQAIQKYKESMKEEKFPIHSRLHYSTSSYVSYYLVRVNPFINSLIKLQNYAMENPNRTFDSIFNTQTILENTTDCRELIPEFFCSMEFMINFNCCFYGIKTDKSIVDDVINKQKTNSNNTKNKLIANKETKNISDKAKDSNKDNENTNKSSKAITDYIRTLIFNRRIINNSHVAKEIINWINYIFGVNQLTKKAESCNIFQKSSYSQNINLEEKLKKYEKKFQDNKDEIFERLNNKINLIINFGQTPLQLFKHLHPPRESEKDKTETDDIEGITYLISRGGSKRLISKDDDDRLIYINDYISDKLLLCFTKKKKIIIADIDTENTVKDTPSIVVQLRFKLGEKITKTILDSKKEKTYKVYYYLDSLDYAYISLPHTNIIITCRYLDNSFKFHTIKEGTKEQKEYSIVTEDYVSAIGKISNQKFIIGLNNGKIIEYALELLPSKSYKCIEQRFLLAHEGRIRVIEYNKRLNILITAGDDGYIYIRKAYNYELLSTIKVDEGFKIISCKVSDCNLLYAFCSNYASKEQKNLIIGYTLNGIEFARSKERYYTNITLLDNGNLVAGEITEKVAYIFNGYDLTDKARTKCNYTEKRYFTNCVSYIQFFNSRLYTTYEFRMFGCLKTEKNEDFN